MHLSPVKNALTNACRYILLAVLIMALGKANAEDLVVTSKADSGPGTLRAALIAAAANGQLLQDRILFNLPGASEADFTILISAQLPDVSSNLVIDGTSQPGNSIAGTANAHVLIKSTIQPLNSFSIFKGTGVHDVEIYGLLMWDANLLSSSDPARPRRYGIRLQNSERITVGKSGKGNWFDGYNEQSIEMTDCRTVSIVANTFHRRPGNNDPDDTAPIFLNRVIGLNFGEPGAGNVVFTLVLVSLESSTEVSKLVFIDNNFAVAADGKTTTPRGKAGVRITGGAVNETDPNSLADILFTGNLFSHFDTYGIQIDFLKGKAVIRHNWFGTDRAATLQLNWQRDPGSGRGTAIALSRFIGDLEVGDPDPAQANIFGYAEYGVTIRAVTNLLLMRNSFRCISKAEFDPGYDDIPKTTVTSFASTAISGTAAPGALVDLFLGDDCTRCSPYKYITSTTANTDGTWQYVFPQPVMSYVTANSHLGKKSSNFTQVIIDTDLMEVTDAKCGMPGSIKNIRVSNTNAVKWIDRDGKIVATSLNLVNMPPGGYKLVAGDFCTTETAFIDIQDLNVRVNDAYRKIGQPVCDKFGGSITGLILVNQNYADPATCRWIDSQQKTVGTSIDLNNVGAGTYFLKLTTVSGCESSYGPVILTSTNTSLLYPNTASAVIIPDDCTGATGSITGVEVTGGQAPYRFLWKDALGLTVGAQASLTHAKAGNYTLTITDASGSVCNSAVLNFEIPSRNISLPAPVISPVSICGPGAAQLRVINPGKGKYKLYNSATSATPIQENDTGYFVVTVSVNATFYISMEVGMCSSPRTQVNVQLAGGGIIIRSSFTPNGDGVNDIWDIGNIDAYPNATIKIFNRMGTEVFSAKGYQRPFNGKKNNRDLPVGTYYYLIDLGTGCKPLSGPVTILR